MPELHPYDVLLRPVITEKVNRLVSEHNQVVFEVARHANKNQIKQAIEIVFGIDPLQIEDVRTMNMPAKRGRRGRKIYIRKRAWKKAIVALGPDANIPLFNV